MARPVAFAITSFALTSMMLLAHFRIAGLI